MAPPSGWANTLPTRRQEKLKNDLVTARERARMHSYLAREASAELTWIKFLEQRLTDQPSLATAINSER